MPIHMMIDFETMAITPNAAVASLGYTVFDNSGVLETGSWVINMASSILVGGVVDTDTVEWWRNQNHKAKQGISHGGEEIGIVMSDLQCKWDERDCDFIWSHGAVFDIPLAEFYFRATCVSIPWKYSAARDTRTLFDLANAVGWERPKRDTDHIAENDARDQTMDVIRAFQHMDTLVG